MAAEPLTATWHGSAGHSKTWLHTENTPANRDQGRAKSGRQTIVGHKVKKIYNNPQEEEHGTGMPDAVLGPGHHLKP